MRQNTDQLLRPICVTGEAQPKRELHEEVGLKERKAYATHTKQKKAEKPLTEEFKRWVVTH